MQDSKGFIWFSTDRGVCRFDGSNFKTFTTAEGLSDNTVFEAIEDSKHRIWFRSFSGRISFYFNERIYSIKNSELIQDILKGNTLNSLHVSNDDQMYLGGESDTVYILRLDST
jgi:ligand-binding sensor domain-containing protein